MSNATTVDELAINVVAEAKPAADSIGLLVTALEGLDAILAPAVAKLAALAVVIPKVSMSALKGTIASGSVELGKTGTAADNARAELLRLGNQFRETQTGMAAGTIPANTAFKQMGTILGNTNTQIMQMKRIGTDLIPSSELELADAGFSKMDFEVKKLASSLGVVPPSLNKASIAAERFGGSLKSFQNNTKNVDPISPNFPVQLDQAKRALAQMKSQLFAVSREQSTGGAFNTTQISRYSSAISAATNRLQKLTTTAAFAQKMQSSTVMMGGAGFPAAPLAYTPAFTQSATVASAAMKTTTAAIKETAPALATVQNKVSSFTQKLQAMGTDGTKATNMLGGSFIQLRSTIFFAFFAIGALVVLFKAFVGASAMLIEKINLFKVTMGKGAEAASAYGDAITNALGLDPMAFKTTNANFQLLAVSLGMTAEKATIVSRNLTQLAYDYASFKDMSFADVEAKFTSALAGQTRAVARLGIDVTLAALKVEALKEGIKGNVTEFTKANKVILMHNIMLRQSTLAQGDLARTLASPTNMMRILGDQFQVAARTIGYLFIPALSAILPVLIAIIQGITSLTQRFIGLFGIEMPSWTDMTNQLGQAAVGTDDLFNDMTGTAAATKAAADAAKKLKDYTMGIDELNIMKPPEADKGAAGGPNINPFGVYDMIGGAKGLSAIVAPVLAEFKKLGVVFKPFLDALGRVWDALKPFVKNVWQGFVDFWNNTMKPMAVWTINTIGVAALETIRKILEWFNDHPNAAKLLGEALGAFVALKGLDMTIGILSTFFGLLGGAFGLSNITGVIDGVGRGIGGIIDVVAGISTMSIPIKSAPWVRDLTNTGIGIKDLFAGSGAVGGVGTAISGIFDAFATGGASEGFTALGAALGPTGWIAIGVALIATVIWANWDKISKWGTDLWDSLAPIRQLFTDTVATMKTAMAPAMDALSSAWDQLKVAMSNIWDIVVLVWNLLGQPVIEQLGTAISGILLAALYALVIALSIVAGVLPGIIQLIAGLAEVIISTFNLAVATATFDSKGIAKALAGIGKGVADYIGGSVSAATGFVSGAKAGITAVNTSMQKFAANTATTTKTVSANADSMGKHIKGALTINTDGAINNLHKLYDKWAKIAKIASTAGSIQHEALLNSFSDTFSNKFTNAPAFAAGGMPTSGTMFRAGETGPELTGSFNGNPNTVMPLANSGFVEAMASAVYSATVAAMGTTKQNSGGTGDVYIDGVKAGKVIKASTTRAGLGGMVSVGQAG